MAAVFFFSSRGRHTKLVSDWSSDVCSSDLGVDAHRLAPEQMLPSEHYLHPGENLAVRLHVDQSARTRDRRVVRRRLAQTKPQEAPNRQRIRRAPGDPPFRVQSLEVPQQQKPEVTPGR